MMARSQTADKRVYFFGKGKASGKGDQRNLLGGKGAGLAEMTRIGLPVPAGFTITTEMCRAYNKRGGKWPVGLEKEIRFNLSKLERCGKKKLGASRDPLLVSVRSGAARSMPGMMDTILNLGLNDQSVEGLARVSSSRRFAMDSYRRFIMMYGSTAKGIDKDLFEKAFDDVKQTQTRLRLGLASDASVADTDVNADELTHLVDRFKHIYREQCGQDFPQDPFEQLRGAINAVFDSWMSGKAITYRKVEQITGLQGTAVNVCQMVFGNMGEDSGTGVCFTRDPSTGEAVFFGDFLINAQGEDVVAGVRTPMKLSQLHSRMPRVYEQLEAVRVMLEVHYRDMQDLEFTIERGRLYMLQCRVGKRSPQAAFKIAVDQATKGLMTAAAARRLVRKKYLPARYAHQAAKPILTKDEAVGRMGSADIERLFYPVLDPAVSSEELTSHRVTSGIGAVPGAACGEVVFSAEEAQARGDRSIDVILVRKETSPEDVGGMHAAKGILTARGGKTSHAAVVARGWGKCCIVGCEALRIDYEAKTLSVNGRVVREGEAITLDGNTGEVYEGRFPLVPPEASPEFQTLMIWCDKRRRLRVRANADTPEDAAKAVALGAEGIGLCRTEHMFFDPSQPQRIRAMREMILAHDEPSRRRALEKLLPFQREDFEGIFEAMAGRPVTIRLLDPPLHEFLPTLDQRDSLRDVVDDLNSLLLEQIAVLAPWDHDARRNLQAKLVTVEDIEQRIDQLHEVNPMLGHRGCRLCITYPEILEMQVRAIMEAAVRCRERGLKVVPEIMIPLSIDAKELSLLVDRTRAVADHVLRQHKSRLKYLVGTMIETPRAALLAKKMAAVSEFFSFGTNDLTQMTMGLSRDDAGRFLPDYVDEQRAGIFADDPFQSLDIEGVGRLVELACQEGRAGRAKLKLGICGEHGGDPASIAFCHKVGLDYVSCSPLRVPVARLAAAQAVSVGKPLRRKAQKATGTRPRTSTSKTKAKVFVHGKAKPRGRRAGKATVKKRTR